MDRSRRTARWIDFVNRADVLEATQEALIAAEALAAHAERLRGRLSGYFPLKPEEDRRDDAILEQLHAMLRMFEQLYDLIARRLFRGAIALVDEDPSALSAKALVLRLEQLGAVSSRADWIRLGETRNALVHDYPVTPAAFAGQANLAAASLDLLVAQLRTIAAYLRAEGLSS